MNGTVAQLSPGEISRLRRALEGDVLEVGGWANKWAGRFVGTVLTVAALVIVAAFWLGIWWLDARSVEPSVRQTKVETALTILEFVKSFVVLAATPVLGYIFAKEAAVRIAHALKRP